MNKVLFITRYFGDMMGGTVCSNRNKKSLESIFDEVIEYKIINKTGFSNIFSRIEQILWVYMGGINEYDKKYIINILNKNKCNHVFVDSSLMGYLCKYIKKFYPNIVITCFFHNFEYSYINEIYSGFKKALYSKWTLKNELLACKFANHIISLNNRDAFLIEKYYKRKPDICIPISITDTYNNNTIVSPLNKQYVLFVGSFFPPNIQGITWFMKQVMPEINIDLIIVGRDMNKLEIPPEVKEKVHLYSNVPNLDLFYKNATAMVMPIFSGSGMKVKTAEALMQGKYIIGSTEALEGYEINDSISKICNSKLEFIKAINNLIETNIDKFNVHSRDLFLKKYEFKSTLNLFKQIFNESTSKTLS